MLRYLHQLWKSKFARSVAIVASGTAAAQFIGIAFSPIITRLYGPEAFGILGTYTALLAILTPIAALSYPIAIVLPKHDADAKGIAKLSIRLSFVTSALVAILLLIAEKPLLKLLNIGEVGKFIWFVPVAMMLSVWLTVATNWAVRKKLFKLKAKVGVISALLQNLLKSGIGLVAPLASVLITLATLGSLLNAALLYFGIRKEPREKLALEERQLTQKELAKRHIDFAYYRTPQIMLFSVSQSMPVLMLTTLFGPVAAGFYVLAKTVLGMPITLIGQSVNTVFYPHFNEAILANRSGTSLIIKATLGLLLAGAIPLFFVLLFGPFLFKIIFGYEWVVAGELAQWMIIGLLFQLAAKPAIGAIPVLKLQGAFLLFEVLAGVLRLSSLYLAYRFYNSLESTVAAYSIINIFIYLILFIWVLKESSKKKSISM